MDMALPQSLTERMAHTRRRQERHMGGLAPQPVAPSPVGRGGSRVANEPTITAAPAREMSRERAGRLWEFEALLPVMARHYGYGETDVAGQRAAVSAPTRQGDLELSLCIRQWLLDAVSSGLDTDLPEGTARRARILFRQAVMGERVDENGEPYRPDALDWRPEPTAVAVTVSSCRPRAQ